MLTCDFATQNIYIVLVQITTRENKPQKQWKEVLIFFNFFYKYI